MSMPVTGVFGEQIVFMGPRVGRPTVTACVNLIPAED